MLAFKANVKTITITKKQKNFHQSNYPRQGGRMGWGGDGGMGEN